MTVKELIMLLTEAPPDNEVAIEIDGAAWAQMDGAEFRDFTIHHSDPPGHHSDMQGLTVLIPE